MPTLPILDLDHANELYEQYSLAIGTLRGAISTVAMTRPSERDYRDADAFHDAMREHASRLFRLESVMSELEELAGWVSDE